MGKVCCLCGRKIGMLDGGIRYFQNEKEFHICEKCVYQVNVLVEASDGKFINEEYIDEARTYVTQTMQNNKGIMSNDNKTFFINLLSEVDKGIQKSQEKKEEQERQAKDKEQRKQNFMVTTGYDFQGYNIKKYIDIVSCEYVIGTGVFSEFMASFSDTFGASSNTFSDKIAKSKQQVLEQMKIDAIELGANALIGIDFDILTFNNNMIAVSGNGTAVYIETE